MAKKLDEVRPNLPGAPGETFGQAIWRLMDKKSAEDGRTGAAKYKPVDLARATGLAVSTISNVMNDLNEPTMRTVRLLADVLGDEVLRAYLKMNEDLVYFWRNEGNPITDGYLSEAKQKAETKISQKTGGSTRVFERSGVHT